MIRIEFKEMFGLVITLIHDVLAALAQTTGIPLFHIEILYVKTVLYPFEQMCVDVSS